MQELDSMYAHSTLCIIIIKTQVALCVFNADSEDTQVPRTKRGTLECGYEDPLENSVHYNFNRVRVDGI